MSIPEEARIVQATLSYKNGDALLIEYAAPRTIDDALEQIRDAHLPVVEGPFYRAGDRVHTATGYWRCVKDGSPGDWVFFWEEGLRASTREAWSMEPTQRGDEVAYQMREYYEANRPLRWWEKRKPPSTWGCTADDLMLGLRNIVLDAEREYRGQAGRLDE